MTFRHRAQHYDMGGCFNEIYYSSEDEDDDDWVTGGSSPFQDTTWKYSGESTGYQSYGWGNTYNTGYGTSYYGGYGTGYYGYGGYYGYR